jgi:hypothetical protein
MRPFYVEANRRENRNIPLADRRRLTLCVDIPDINKNKDEPRILYYFQLGSEVIGKQIFYNDSLKI